MAAKYGYIGNSPENSSVVVARQTFSVAGVTTTFSFGSGYTIGYLDAYLNGSRLIEGQDYVASNGSTVDLVSAAGSGDILELVAYKAFNLTTPPFVGIQSAGTVVTANATTLNFVGTGNTFAVNGNTVDISIQGGGGGVSTTGIVTCRGFANAEDITESIILNDFYGGGTNYGMIGPIHVSVGATVTVGLGVSYAII